MMSLCWQCGKPLALPYFAVWTDPLGHRHRVHKICKRTLDSEPKPTTITEKVTWQMNNHFMDDGDESP